MLKKTNQIVNPILALDACLQCSVKLTCNNSCAVGRWLGSLMRHLAKNELNSGVYAVGLVNLGGSPL